MAKSKGFWLFLALVAAGVAYWATRPAPQKEGLAAPDFTLKDRQERPLSLKDLRGSFAVVHFWGSWCPPCVPELPLFLAAAKRLPKNSKGAPIRWIAVSVDESWAAADSIRPKDPALAGAAEFYLDRDAKVAEAFGTYQYPETYVISDQGNIIAKWIGPQDWEGAWGKEALLGIDRASLGKAL